MVNDRAALRMSVKNEGGCAAQRASVLPALLIHVSMVVIPTRATSQRAARRARQVGGGGGSAAAVRRVLGALEGLAPGRVADVVAAVFSTSVQARVWGEWGGAQHQREGAWGWRGGA